MAEDSTTEPTETTPEPKPPWGDDSNFDAQKAWKLITDLREDNKKRTSAEVARLQKQLDELKPLAAEAQKLRDEKKSDVERLTERLAVLEAEKQSAGEQAVRSKIEALAARDFADPEDAAAFLDPSKYLVNGKYDVKSIQSDLDDLLKRKPHLGRAVQSAPRPPAPDRTQGSSGSGAPVSNDPHDIFASFLQRQMPTHRR